MFACVSKGLSLKSCFSAYFPLCLWHLLLSIRCNVPMAACECWWVRFTSLTHKRDAGIVCPGFSSTIRGVCVPYMCVWEGFVYGYEERRYSHIRRCLATAMHRLARTSVADDVAKSVLYSKQEWKPADLRSDRELDSWPWPACDRLVLKGATSLLGVIALA